MILMKELMPHKEGFAYVHPNVLTNTALSDKAKVVYAYLTCIPSGEPCYDSVICEDLNISITTLTRAKTELKTIGLIKTDRIKGNIWVTYLGTPDCLASKVIENVRKAIHE